MYLYDITSSVMSKPSVWQALLGKPSQSYPLPSDKDYFSSKQHMLSIASAQSADNDSNDDELTSAARTVLRLTEMYEEEDRGNMPDSEDNNNDPDDEDDDVFYTPNTSPRLSLISNASSALRRTPGTSRPASQRSSVATTTRVLLSNANAAGNDPPTTSVANRRSKRTLVPATTTGKKEAETMKDETRVLNSNSSTSTTATSSTASASASAKQSRNKDPITSSNKRHTAPSSSFLGARSLFGSSMSDSTKTPSSFRLENGAARSTEDSDHDSLANGQTTKSNSSSKRKPLPSQNSSFSNGSAGYVPPPRKQNNVLKVMSKTNPSLMMNMSALLEEEEDVTSAGVDLRTYTNGSQPPSSVVVVQPDNSKHNSVHNDPASRSRRNSNRSTMPKSRDSHLNGGDNSHKLHKLRVPSLRHRRSRSHEDLRSSSSRSSTRSRVVSTSTALTSLPVPTGELPSHGTPGYTSLVLPRAPPPVSLNPRMQAPKFEPSIDGKVDLTRSGIAQTTMATVEVVYGLGASSRGKGLLGVLGKGVGLGRRKTFSGRTGPDASIGGSIHRPLGFTSYRKPPDYVSSSSVLVQVWAVGVDGIDARLVGLRLGSGQRGDRSRNTNLKSRSTSSRWKFVRAGRSFVGRVLECGWEVGEEVVRKGDWVIGLLDIRKAGALAEFIVVDKRRIYRVPHPKMPEMSAKAIGKQPERSNSTNRVPVWGLTLEELALLPLCGVPAYRAVRTFVYAFSASATKEEGGLTAGSARIMSSPMDNETGKRRHALVLRGHDGVGAMAARMLIAKGWDVSIHAPCNYPTESDEAEAYMSAIEDRARSWGCNEVIFDDGLEQGGDEGRGAIVRVLERLWSEGDVVDAILDTVGGKEVWDVAERLLKSPSSGPAAANLSKSSSNGSARLAGNKKGSKGVAQFTTLVGDSPSRVVPSAGDLFRAGVRSLRMGGKPSASGSPKLDDGSNTAGRTSGRGEKRVAYAWVSAAQDVDWEGQDVSESIAAVLRLTLEGVAKPWVDTENRVGSFDKTPDIFVDDGPLSHGSTMVVKVVS